MGKDWVLGWVVPACAGMTGRGAGVTEGSRGVTEVWMRLGGCGLRLGRWWTLGTPTPHLASPLKGGRDELGKGWVLGA